MSESSPWGAVLSGGVLGVLCVTVTVKPEQSYNRRGGCMIAQGLMVTQITPSLTTLQTTPGPADGGPVSSQEPECRCTGTPAGPGRRSAAVVSSSSGLGRSQAVPGPGPSVRVRIAIEFIKTPL